MTVFAIECPICLLNKIHFESDCKTEEGLKGNLIICDECLTEFIYDPEMHTARID